MANQLPLTIKPYHHTIDEQCFFSVAWFCHNSATRTIIFKADFLKA